MIDRRLSRIAAFALIAPLGAALVGCSQPAPPPAPPVKLREGMVNIVAPQAQTLWDVSNRGTNEEGEPDATKLTTADWQALVAASQAMRDEAAKLADAKAVLVAAPGEKIQNEGESGASGAAQVQQYIDRDLAGFNKHAADLREIADALLAASTAKDAKKLLDSAGELDAVCEACHVKFWYPQEVAAQNAAEANAAK